VLLDSNVLLFAAADPGKLTPKVRDLLESPACDIYVSTGTIWELLLKARKGKLRIGTDTVASLKTWCAKLRARVVPVTDEHVYRAVRLQGLHKDPFDRLLVAQAQTEDLALVTSDSVLPDYHVETIW
jgi:PIN domain nuclease of toxin-antitoxin system